MKSFHGLLAGTLVLAAVVGCGDVPPPLKDKGSYAPIITGLKNNTGEPAVRGIPNDLQVLITNVNELTLTIHWSASAGVFSDSTGLTAVWTPPDAVGTDTVVVSVESSDGTKTFFKSTTFPMYVDNLYERWTKDIAIQFDPAPTASGGLVFAQFRNNITGAGDVYRITAPLGLTEKLTSNFFSVASPTPRGDEQQVAFTGRRRTSDSTSIWLLPWAGGDTLTATKLTQANNQLQRFLGHPRFSWNGAFLMYASDSDLIGLPKLWYRDAMTLVAPVRLVSNSPTSDIVRYSYLPANWGPGGTNTAPPDSIVTPSVEAFNVVGQTARGTFKFRTPLFVGPAPATDLAWIADTTIAEPDWSFNGTHIVFSRRAPGTTHRDIWMLPTDATSFAQATQITRGPADDSHPRFSKDGSVIFFVSNRQDRYGLNGIFATERRGTNLWSVRRYDIP